MKIIREKKKGQNKHLSKASLQGILQTSKIKIIKIIPEMLYLILFLLPDIHIYTAKVLEFNSQ